MSANKRRRNSHLYTNSSSSGNNINATSSNISGGNSSGTSSSNSYNRSSLRQQQLRKLNMEIEEKEKSSIKDAPEATETSTTATLMPKTKEQQEEGEEQQQQPLSLSSKITTRRFTTTTLDDFVADDDDKDHHQHRRHLEIPRICRCCCKRDLELLSLYETNSNNNNNKLAETSTIEADSNNSFNSNSRHNISLTPSPLNRRRIITTASKAPTDKANTPTTTAAVAASAPAPEIATTTHQQQQQPRNNNNPVDYALSGARSGMNIVLEEMSIWMLNIDRDDGLPQEICRQCKAQFLMVAKFRRKCVRTQQRLRDFAGTGTGTGAGNVSERSGEEVTEDEKANKERLLLTKGDDDDGVKREECETEPPAKKIIQEASLTSEDDQSTKGSGEAAASSLANSSSSDHMHLPESDVERKQRESQDSITKTQLSISTTPKLRKCKLLLQKIQPEKLIPKTPSRPEENQDSNDDESIEDSPEQPTYERIKPWKTKGARKEIIEESSTLSPPSPTSSNTSSTSPGRTTSSTTTVVPNETHEASDIPAPAASPTPAGSTLSTTAQSDSPTTSTGQRTPEALSDMSVEPCHGFETAADNSTSRPPADGDLMFPKLSVGGISRRGRRRRGASVYMPAKRTRRSLPAHCPALLSTVDDQLEAEETESSAQQHPSHDDAEAKEVSVPKEQVGDQEQMSSFSEEFREDEYAMELLEAAVLTTKATESTLTESTDSQFQPQTSQTEDDQDDSAAILSCDFKIDDNILTEQDKEKILQGLTILITPSSDQIESATELTLTEETTSVIMLRSPITDLNQTATRDSHEAPSPECEVEIPHSSDSTRDNDATFPNCISTNVASEATEESERSFTGHPQLIIRIPLETLSEDLHRQLCQSRATSENYDPPSKDQEPHSELSAEEVNNNENAENFCQSATVDSFNSPVALEAQKIEAPTTHQPIKMTANASVPAEPLLVAETPPAKQADNVQEVCGVIATTPEEKEMAYVSLGSTKTTPVDSESSVPTESTSVSLPSTSLNKGESGTSATIPVNLPESISHQTSNTISSKDLPKIEEDCAESNISPAVLIDISDQASMPGVEEVNASEDPLAIPMKENESTPITSKDLPEVEKVRDANENNSLGMPAMPEVDFFSVFSCDKVESENESENTSPIDPASEPEPAPLPALNDEASKRQLEVEMNDVEITLNGILNEMQDQHIYTPVCPNVDDFLTPADYAPLTEQETPAGSVKVSYTNNSDATIKDMVAQQPSRQSCSGSANELFARNFSNYGGFQPVQNPVNNELIGFQNDMPCFENIGVNSGNTEEVTPTESSIHQEIQDLLKELHPTPIVTFEPPVQEQDPLATNNTQSFEQAQIYQVDSNMIPTPLPGKVQLITLPNGQEHIINLPSQDHIISLPGQEQIISLPPQEQIISLPPQDQQQVQVFTPAIQQQCLQAQNTQLQWSTVGGLETIKTAGNPAEHNLNQPTTYYISNAVELYQQQQPAAQPQMQMQSAPLIEPLPGYSTLQANAQPTILDTNDNYMEQHGNNSQQPIMILIQQPEMQQPVASASNPQQAPLHIYGSPISNELHQRHHHPRAHPQQLQMQHYHHQQQQQQQQQQQHQQQLQHQQHQQQLQQHHQQQQQQLQQQRHQQQQLAQLQQVQKQTVLGLHPQLHPHASLLQQQQQQQQNPNPLLTSNTSSGNNRFVTLKCRFCHNGPRFSSSLEYSKHIIDLHPAVAPFNCPHCPLAFAGRTRRQQHILSHHFVQSYQCGQCNQVFPAQRALDLHIQRHHAPPVEPEYTYETSSQSGVRLEEVQLQMSSSADGESIDIKINQCRRPDQKPTNQKPRILCCPDCEDCEHSPEGHHKQQQEEQSPKMLQEESVIEELPQPPNVLTPPSTIASLPSPQPIHITLPSPEQSEPDSTTTLRQFRKRRTSPATGGATLSPQTAVSVMPTPSPSSSPSSSTNEIACNTVALIGSDSRSPLQLTELRGSQQCIYCEERFTNEIALRKHHHLAHGSPTTMPFVCSICKRGYRMRNALHRHMETHNSVGRPYECNLCRVRFPRPSQLTLHKITVHLLSKPHTCDECGKQFGTESALKTHIKFHGDRGYPCDQCGKRFVFLKGLRKHRRIHSGEKFYKCKYCARSFLHYTPYRAHMNSHLPLGVFLNEEAGLLPAAGNSKAEKNPSNLPALKDAEEVVNQESSSSSQTALKSSNNSSNDVCQTSLVMSPPPSMESIDTTITSP